jgi:alkylhydroperoxidase family enzyme
MARLPFLEASALAEEHRDLTMRQNFQRVYANSPASMRAFMSVSSQVRNHSALDPRLRELAILQVGSSAFSPYVFTHHVKSGLEAGLSEEAVRALGAGRAEAHALDPVAAAVVELAREMTSGNIVADATFEKLRQALGDRTMMDLLFVITHYIGMATLLRTLSVELEDHYHQYLRYWTELERKPANPTP